MTIPRPASNPKPPVCDKSFLIISSRLNLERTKWYQRYRDSISNLLFSLCITCLMLASDFLIQFFTHKNKAFFHVKFSIRFGCVFLILSFFKRPLFLYLALLGCFLLDLIQHHHVCYFGIPVQPGAFDHLLHETTDVWDGFITSFHFYWFVIPILVALYGGIFCLHKKVRGRLLTLPSSITIIALLLYGGYLSKKTIRVLKEIYRVYPSPIQQSLHNSFSALFYSLCQQSGFLGQTKPIYLPYQVTRGNPRLKNIVFIVGESTRHDHMSLFGYDRSTTPFLDSLKEDPKFAYRKAISGAVSTVNSLGILFNMMREPKNLDLIAKGPYNLFKFAKDQGFQTYCLSTQHANDLSLMGSSSMDHIVNIDSKDYMTIAKYHDEALPLLFEGLELGEKNFIVLHMKNLHYPYESHYAHKREEFEKFKGKAIEDQYDNAMLYYDHVVQKIMQVAKKRLGKETVVIFTSDHGEMLGEDHLFGHSILDKRCSFVPFWFYSFDDQLIKTFNFAKTLSHYEISVLVANLLGIDVKNPNQKGDTFFLHGEYINQDYNFMEYTRDTWGDVTFSKVHNVAEIEPAPSSSKG